MKKLIFIFTIALFFGCSNDDSGSSASQKLIGKWKLVSEFYGFNETALEDCQLNSTLEFSPDETFVSRNYNDQCGFVMADGTWTKRSASRYELSSGGFTAEYEIKFPTANTMELKLEDVIPEAPGYILRTYERVE